MSDLIKRMRESPSCKELENGIDAETTKIWDRLFHEAADEIKRLTAELAGVDKAWDECRTDKRKLRAKLAAAEKAVEAARGKCHQIISYHNSIDVYPFDGDERGARAAAREILRELEADDE